MTDLVSGGQSAQPSDDLSYIFKELEDIEVDADGKCDWAHVANATTLMRLELKRALADWQNGFRAALGPRSAGQSDNQSDLAAPTGGTAQAVDKQSGERPPASAAMGHRAGSDTLHYLSAIRKRLEQFYDEFPDDARLREQVSDEIDWVDEQIAACRCPVATDNWIRVGDQEPEAEQRVLIWCVFPAGEDCREARYRYKKFWSYGVVQNATHWQPMLRKPGSCRIPAESVGAYIDEHTDDGRWL